MPLLNLTASPAAVLPREVLLWILQLNCWSSVSVEPQITTEIGNCECRNVRQNHPNLKARDCLTLCVGIQNLGCWCCYSANIGVRAEKEGFGWSFPAPAHSRSPLFQGESRKAICQNQNLPKPKPTQQGQGVRSKLSATLAVQTFCRCTCLVFPEEQMWSKSFHLPPLPPVHPQHGWRVLVQFQAAPGLFCFILAF